MQTFRAQAVDPRLDESAIVPGEFKLTQRDFEKIATMLKSETGIYLSDAKAALLYSRLAKRLRDLNLRSFRDYCALLEAPEGADEHDIMVSALTTNVTRFFREAHHFEDLKKNLLPKLLKEARAGRRVRFWSAGCSSGEEPYSLALTILAIEPGAANLDVKVLATDIDRKMVAFGTRGVYRDESFDSVPSEMKHRHFHPLAEADSKAWSADESLRQIVSFRQLNLLAPWPMKGTFDVIFCRNVVIYFDAATQQTLWTKFASKLNHGGRFYIGHSERLSGPSASRFRPTCITGYSLESEKRA